MCLEGHKFQCSNQCFIEHCRVFCEEQMKECFRVLESSSNILCQHLKGLVYVKVDKMPSCRPFLGIVCLSFYWTGYFASGFSICTHIPGIL